MRTSPAKQIAFGGVFGALALVIMNLGSLIPVATYVCPVLCMLILAFVTKMCGNRIGWAWYGAVAILSCLMAPDKEAAAVFVFLGFYPILKHRFDRFHFPMIPKLLFFNVLILAMYWLLLHLLGMDQSAAEFEEMGKILTAVLLLMGNLVFILLDIATAVSIPELPQMWKSGWKPTAAARAPNTPEAEDLWNLYTGKNAAITLRL